MSPKPLILIVGPTAVGKTDTAIQLACRMNGEIVSADSRLFYRGMDIGTAKPTIEERSRVPHHLIDIADPDETLSLAAFQQKARQVIADIHARGKLPFLVGGTGQYIRSVTQGWTPPKVEPDARLRGTLEKLGKEKSIYWLHAALCRLDPLAGSQIDARNLRRTVRALEVIFSTGRRFSGQRGAGISPHHLITIGLGLPRAELYKRVDARIESMFSHGLLDEVRRLLADGYPASLPSMSAIGYRQCMRVLQGELTVEQAKAEMRRLTRVFVRRQANWFKETDPRIFWFDTDHKDALDRIEAHIRNSLGIPVL